MTHLFDKQFLTKLERLSVLARRVQRGEHTGRHATQQRGASVEFVDHRVYSPGDDLRYLDWNVYGRLGTLFTKQFSSEENINLKIFLDCSRSMDYGAPNKFDVTRQLAATLGYVGLNQWERVEVIPFAGGARRPSFTASTKRAFFGLLDFLAAQTPEGATGFRETFQAPMPPERGKRVGFFISDFLDADGYEYPIRRLRLQRIALTGLHVMDPTEWDPTWTGNLRMVDRETGERLDLNVAEDTLARYRRGVQAFVGELQRFFTAAEAGYIRALTSTPLEDTVLVSLRRAGILTGVRA